MKDKLEILKEKIEKKREELNMSIENGKDEKTIYQKNIELDKLIAEYIKCERQKEVLDKYNYILNNPYKGKVIEAIKNDVKSEIKGISNYELECYCNNVYVYACLKAYNIDEDEIARQILYHNNIVAEKLEGRKSSHIYISRKFNTDISNKYYEIVKKEVKTNKVSTKY